MLPRDVLIYMSVKLLQESRAIGRLASSSKELLADLSDEGGRLCVGSIRTFQVQSTMDSLNRASPTYLEVLRVDLSAENFCKLSPKGIEHAVATIAHHLPSATALCEFALRLATFDFAMQRLRLGSQVWEALVCGMGALAQHQRLRSLELSSFSFKESRLTSAVPLPLTHANSKFTQLSFLEVLGQLSSLEELALVSDEIFGRTAKLIAEHLANMSNLRKIDFTRNHISPQAMQSVSLALPQKIKLCGKDQQTFCF